MSTSSAPKRKPVYDPVRQWGLKPEENSTSGATYVVAGHIISGSGFSDSMHIAETMGREGQAKAKRKLIGKDTDRALKALLDRDKEGMKAVVRAREVATKYRQEGDKKTEVGSGLVISPNEDAVAQVNSPPNQKNSYSAEVIKQLGFDPAAKPGQRRDSLMAKKKARRCCAPSGKV
jgi:minichromosome maintenance protein 10